MTRSGHETQDLLEGAYFRQLAAQGSARKGIAAYRYQLRAIRHIAERLAGRSANWVELFGDSDLLGRVLVHDVAPTLGIRVSRWTLAQRRSAIRSFAVLMRPELRAALGEEPVTVVDRALRGVAERVGAGYRLSGGMPRRRGGNVPTEGELTAVLEALGRTPGYLGLRDRAFFTILAETGARVNALRTLDGADCIEMPSGRLRVFLHEKGKAEPREVELSGAATDSLRSYVDLFNRCAAANRWCVRVHLGEPGAIWRNTGRGRWSYGDVGRSLRVACESAGVEPFAPHALRRAFATEAAERAPRHVVALAGGWQGIRRLDEHYVQPRADAIWEKLIRRAQPAEEGEGAQVRSNDAALVP